MIGENILKFWYVSKIYSTNVRLDNFFKEENTNFYFKIINLLKIFNSIMKFFEVFHNVSFRFNYYLFLTLDISFLLKYAHLFLKFRNKSTKREC